MSAKKYPDEWKHRAGLEVFYKMSKALALVLAFSLCHHPELFAQRAPRVIIDGSLEFTFLWSTDWWEGTLAKSYLQPMGFEYTLSQETLDSTVFNYDVLVIEQTTVNIQVSKPLGRLIQGYVNHGGGLLLVGKGWAWQNIAPHSPNEAYPVDYIASFFGIQFTTATAAKPYTVLPHEITTGVSDFDNGTSAAGILLLPSGAEVLVKDGQGRPILGALRYGNGRVVALAENDCLAPQLPGTPRNVLLLQNALSWLKAGMAAQNTGMAIPYRIYPERSLTLGGATLLYAASLGTRAQFLLTRFPTVYGALRGLMGTELTRLIRVVALASGGGGYSGGNEIGVGVLASDYYTLAVLAHELTHSWVLPGYEELWMGEGWASLAAIRVTTGMGYESNARAERASFDGSFRQVDPTGTQLDLSTSSHAYEPGYPPGPAYMGKCMWVIETLENQFRKDLMKRYVRLKRKYLTEGTTMFTDRTVYFLSLAAGYDLYAYFQRIGTTALVPKSVLPVVYLTSPEAGADSVSTTAPIVITFSDSMDSATLNSATFLVTGSRSGIIAGSVSYLDSTQSAVFTPTTGYEPGETITVRLSKAIPIKDKDGNPLDGNGNGIADGGSDSYVFSFKVTPVTDVKKMMAAMPQEARLEQNYPNPFSATGGSAFGGNPRTRIAFVVPRREHVSLKVYDTLGRELTTLVDGMKNPGRYEVQWNATGLPSGIYYYRLRVGGLTSTRKMTLIW